MAVEVPVAWGTNGSGPVVVVIAPRVVRASWEMDKSSTGEAVLPVVPNPLKKKRLIWVPVRLPLVLLERCTLFMGAGPICFKMTGGSLRGHMSSLEHRILIQGEILNWGE